MNQTELDNAFKRLVHALDELHPGQQADTLDLADALAALIDAKLRSASPPPSRATEPERGGALQCRHGTPITEPCSPCSAESDREEYLAAHPDKRTVYDREPVEALPDVLPECHGEPISLLTRWCAVCGSFSDRGRPWQQSKHGSRYQAIRASQSPPPNAERLPSREKLTEHQADEIEAEMRRLEADPCVSKRQLRLFMQTLMPCGHSVGELLTCPDPPFGCAECNRSLPAPVQPNPEAAGEGDGPSDDARHNARMDALHSTRLSANTVAEMDLAARSFAEYCRELYEGVAHGERKK